MATSENAAAATYINYFALCDGRALINVICAQWINIVQRFEFTVFIPPAAGESFEFCNFSGIDVCHNLSSSKVSQF